MILPLASGLVKQNHWKSIGFWRVASLRKTFKNLCILNDSTMGLRPRQAKSLKIYRVLKGGDLSKTFKNLTFLNDFPMGHKKSSKTAGWRWNGTKSVILGTFLERNPSRSSSIRQLSLSPEGLRRLTAINMNNLNKNERRRLIYLS